MKSAFQLGTFVPGANYTRTKDKKGRPVWQMPRPTAYVEYIQVVKEVISVDDKPRIIKVKKPVRFPVYRGMSAKDARLQRARIKRDHRKRLEKRELDNKKEVLAMMKEVIANEGIENAGL